MVEGKKIRDAIENFNNEVLYLVLEDGTEIRPNINDSGEFILRIE